MPIRRKLFLAFGVIGFMAGLIALLAVTINRGVENDVVRVSHATIEQARAAEGMFEALKDIEVGMVFARNEANQRALGARQRDAVETAVADFEKNLAALQAGTQAALNAAERKNDRGGITFAKHDGLLLDGIADKFARLESQISGDLEKMAGGARQNVLAKVVDSRLRLAVQAYRAGSGQQLQADVEDLETAIRRANVIIIGSTLVLVLLGGVMAWRISGSISHPLDVLTEAAGRIARGHLATKVDIASRDEVGVLARTFNQMTADLQSTTVSKDYLDSILKSMANSLVVVGRDHAIRSVNDATLRMLGCEESGLIGQPMDNVLQDSSLLREVLDGGTLSDVETFYCSKAGDSIPVTLSAALLHDGEGGIAGVVCVAQDISERKKAEAELEETGRKLLEVSRQAGMAEVAASVLHNVGNVLNSVNVSGSVIAGKIRNSKAANLDRAAALLREHAGDLPAFLAGDPKGRLLPGYFSDLAGHLAKEREELLRELDHLVNNIKHIKEIIGMQQSYARKSGVPEKCDVAELVENAVQMNENALERHSIRLQREYAKTPPIVVEKHKVLQILVNLLRNAKYACDEAGVADKRVILRIANGDNRVKISVIDNGVGVPVENLTRIFSHGFTTKKNGHGFGLHSGALAAKEMGGELSVFSEGPGRGSTFTLDLPIHQEGGGDAR